MPSRDPRTPNRGFLVNESLPKCPSILYANPNLSGARETNGTNSFDPTGPFLENEEFLGVEAHARAGPGCLLRAVIFVSLRLRQLPNASNAPEQKLSSWFRALFGEFMRAVRWNGIGIQVRLHHCMQRSCLKQFSCVAACQLNENTQATRTTAAEVVSRHCAVGARSLGLPCTAAQPTPAVVGGSERSVCRAAAPNPSQ